MRGGYEGAPACMLRGEGSVSCGACTEQQSEAGAVRWDAESKVQWSSGHY